MVAAVYIFFALLCVCIVVLAALWIILVDSNRETDRILKKIREKQ